MPGSHMQQTVASVIAIGRDVALQSNAFNLQPIFIAILNALEHLGHLAGLQKLFAFL